ncbi:MAG: hypothetical protein HYS13_04080 [Planctomycetia bacterium]|nr:hypothetical protein [Planctomycetia bacterium]
MSTETISELVVYRRFLETLIQSGCTNVTPEESIRLWRECTRDLPDSVAAVKRALEGLKAGKRGMPLDEFAREFRARNQQRSSE